MSTLTDKKEAEIGTISCRHCNGTSFKLFVDMRGKGIKIGTTVPADHFPLALAECVACGEEYPARPDGGKTWLR